MAEPTDLKLTITADVGQANKALDQLEKDAKSAGNAASVSLGKIESLLESINAAAQSAAGSLGKPFATANPEIQKYAANIQKLEKQVSSLQSQLDKLAKTPAVKPPQGPNVNEIRAKWDPLFAISQKYKENLAEIAAAEKSGALTAATANNARQDAANIANTQMLAVNKLNGSMGQLNNTTKLTSNQLLNLSRQGNDALTMLASGSDIFQVVATQAGQVFGALEEGPNGLKGSAAAIKGYALDFVSFIGPMKLAAAGAAAGIFALAVAAQKSFPDATKVAEKHEDIIKRISAQYEGLTKRINDMKAATPDSFAVDIDLNTKDLRKILSGQLEVIKRDGLARSNEFSLSAFLPIKSFVDDFSKDLADGEVNINAYREEAQALYNQVGQTDQVKKAVSVFLEVTKEAGATETQLKTLGAASRETSTSFQFMVASAEQANDAFSKFRGMTGSVKSSYQELTEAYRKYLDANKDMQGPINPEDAQRYKKAIDDLSRGVRDAATEAANAVKNSSLGPLERQLAEIRQRVEAEKKAYAEEKGDPAGLAAIEARGQAEIELAKINHAKAQDALNRSYEASLAAIKAKTPAQKAEIAALEKRNELIAQGITGTELETRVEQARNLVLAQSAQAIDDASQKRIRSGAQNVEQAQFELTLVGKTASEAAALRAEYQLLTSAKQALHDVDPNAQLSQAEVDAYRDQAQAIGAATKELQKLNFERDLAFQTSIAGLPDIEQNIKRQLRDLDIAYDSADGKRIAAQMRYNERLEDGKQKLIDFKDIGESAFDVLTDSIKNGESALGGLMNMFSKLANQLASQAFGKLFGGLFNPGQSTGVGGQGPSVSSVITSAGNLVAGANPSRQSSASFVGAPVGAVQRAALPALGSSSSNSLADSIRNAANTLKISARDLATVISYETGGTFDPWKKGPTTKWGQHIGLIQMGGPQRAANGYAQGNTIDQNMAAVVKYLKSAGVKPGHGLLELYSSINAGGIGEKYFNRSDSHVGGAPGTVRDKVKYQMEGHKANADRLLGKTAVSEGFIDAQKKIANGQAGVANVPIPTARPSSNIPIPTARPTNGAGGGLLSGTNGWTGAGSILGVQYPAFSAMGGISAGLGGFGSGYSSGSPISGGLTGGLSGFMAGGPIGGLIGLGAGILGGILGGRAQRKQKHMDAAARWEELRPQYEAFDKSLSGDGNGQLRQWITSQKGQLDQFMKVGGEAWKYGTGNSTAQFASTGTKMYQKFMEMMGEYREGFTDMIEDLTSGEGLGGAFAKGRSAAKELKQQIKDMIDDVSIAFISNDIGVPTSAEWEAESKRVEEQRNTAIQQAKEAAGEYALTMLYTSKTTSDVAKSIDGFRGTAAGLQKVLVELGWTAEEAAKDIDDRLKQALADMAKTFTEGFQNEINDLSGVGYFNDIAELFKSRETGMNDAKLLGVDPAIVTKWFTLAVQNVVDGAELTGDAFNELIKKFPELSGVVKDFAESASGAKMTIKEINEALNNAAVSRYDQAIRERSDAEADLRSEYERTKKSIADIKSFLSDMRISEETSLLSGQDRFSEAQKLYRETLAKANSGDVEAQEELLNVTQEYLDEAKAYYASSEQYAEVYKEIESSLNDVVVKSQSQLDYVKSQTNALFDIVTNTKNLTQLLDDYLKKNSAVGGSLSQLDSTRSWGVRPVANKKNVAEFRAAGLPEYTGNFGPDTWPQIQAWLDTLTVEQRDKAMAIMTANNAIGYATGGLVMNGQWNRDSVMAKLAGGEHITRAPSVNNGTRSMLDYINRTGMLPGANDNGRMDGVERRLDRVIQTLATGFNMSVQAIETGNGLTEAQNANAKLMNSR